MALSISNVKRGFRSELVNDIIVIYGLSTGYHLVVYRCLVTRVIG